MDPFFQLIFIKFIKKLIKGRHNEYVHIHHCRFLAEKVNLGNSSYANQVGDIILTCRHLDNFGFQTDRLQCVP